jgi:hypothetical protein
VETLTFLIEQTRPVSKRDLMIHMRGAETIHPRIKPLVSPQALHAQADIVLRRLSSWGFVEISGRGRGMRIRATEMGRGGARMFRHVLRPREAPVLLQI